MKKFSFIVSIAILLSLTISSGLTKTEAKKFFMLPKDNKAALKSLEKEFDLAKSKIIISIYTFTHKKIAKKVQNAAKRGVKVEIIFDERSTKGKNRKSMIYYLAKYKNIKVYKLKGKQAKSKKYYGIMHMKVAVIDNKTVIFGSANWTYSAFSNNYELLYIIKDYAIAKKFTKYFKELKKSATLFK